MPVLTVCLSPGFQRSVLLDSFVPGEVNRIREVFLDVSGKGVNVSRVLGRLGCRTQCLGQGGDNAAELLQLAILERLDIDLVPSGGRLRTCTTIIEYGGRGKVTELVEPAAPVSPGCVEELLARFESQLSHTSALVVAGSMAPGFPPDFQARLVDDARRSGVPAFVDLHGAALRQACEARPSLVKVNLSEFVTTFLPAPWHRGETMGDAAPAQLDENLSDKLVQTAMDLGCMCLLTQGPGPVLLIRDGRLLQCPVPPLPPEGIISPIGSGDAFMAGLVASLHSRNSLSLSPETPDESIRPAIELGILCAQSNARTARPGWLHEDFTQQPS